MSLTSFISFLISSDVPRGRHYRFTLIMTVSATIFGSLQSYRKLRWQDDFISDMLQVQLVIALGTACAAFIIWGLLMRRRESRKRGMAAGFITALCIMPLPAFASKFKKQITQDFPENFTELSESVWIALQLALPIFTSKAILAIPLSMAVGYWVARKSGPSSNTGKP